MSTSEKPRQVWQWLHPEAPPLTLEQGRAMRERALADWDRRVEADPSLLDDYERRCADSEPGGDRSALSD